MSLSDKLPEEQIVLDDGFGNDLPIRPLWKWQQDGIAFGESKNHVGFFMDKRLGKIRVATNWAINRGFKRILVVAPISACPGWQDELLKDHRRHCFLFGSKPERLKQMIDFENHRQTEDEITPFFCMINPQGLFVSRSHAARKTGSQLPQPTEIALLNWDCVIWDESTNLKNPQSQTNHIAHHCFSGPSNNHLGRAILSGEPAPEGPQDLFEQLRWLNGGFFMGRHNFWKWRSDNFDQSGYEWFTKPGKLRLIKEAVASRCFTLSRKDTGLLHAPAHHERLRIDLPKKLRKVYDDAELHFELPKQDMSLDGAEVRFADVAGSTATQETKFAVVVDNWLAQLCGGFPKGFPNLHSPHKLDFLMTLLKEQFPTPKHQVVIAFRFNSELFAVAEALRTTHTIFATLTGATPPADRRNLQNRFSQGLIQIILGQIRVLQFGIDLSAARTMIRYSVPPNYEIISQSKDRIIHAMKQDTVSYIDLCVNDSVDEDTLNALGDKEITSRYFMSRLNLFKFKRLNLKQSPKEIK